MQDGAVVTWREVVDKYQFALVDELTVRLDSEIQTAVARARRTTAESLNQTLRLLRQAPAEAPVLRMLADASVPYANRVVVLSLENGQARSLSVRGIEAQNGFAFSLEDAAAIETAVETKDPVVALAAESEISPAMAAVFGGHAGRTKAEERVYLFPIVARQNVVAMLVASGQVVSAPLELLCEAAGMKIEALVPETSRALAPLKSPELVQIVAPSVSGSATTERRGWDELSAEDQKLHLQAQRTARVRVAEIRLYQGEALRKGVFDGNIYEALRADIDSARTDFLQNFLSKSPTIVDYLHLEILRSLARDDDRLLGPDYPGPMV